MNLKVRLNYFVNKIMSIQHYSPVLVHCALGSFRNILRALHEEA